MNIRKLLKILLYGCIITSVINIVIIVFVVCTISDYDKLNFQYDIHEEYMEAYLSVLDPEIKIITSEVGIYGWYFITNKQIFHVWYSTKDKNWKVGKTYNDNLRITRKGMLINSLNMVLSVCIMVIISFGVMRYDNV